MTYSKIKTRDHLFGKGFLLTILLSNCQNSNITQMDGKNIYTNRTIDCYARINKPSKKAIPQIGKFLISIYTPTKHLENPPIEPAHINGEDKPLIASGYPITLYRHLDHRKLDNLVKAIWDKFHNIYKHILALEDDIPQQIDRLRQDLNKCYEDNQANINELKQKGKKNKKIMLNNIKANTIPCHKIQSSAENPYDASQEFFTYKNCHNMQRPLPFIAEKNTNQLPKNAYNIPSSRPSTSNASEEESIYDIPLVFNRIARIYKSTSSSVTSNTTASVNDSDTTDPLYDQPPLATDIYTIPQPYSYQERTEICSNKHIYDFDTSDPEAIRKLIGMVANRVNITTNVILAPLNFHNNLGPSDVIMNFLTKNGTDFKTSKDLKAATEKLESIVQTLYCNADMLDHIATTLQQKGSPIDQSVKYKWDQCKVKIYDLLFSVTKNIKLKYKNNEYKYILENLKDINREINLFAAHLYKIVPRATQPKGNIFIRTIKNIVHNNRNNPIENIQTAMEQDYHNLTYLLKALEQIPYAIRLCTLYEKDKPKYNEELQLLHKKHFANILSYPTFKTVIKNQATL